MSIDSTSLVDFFNRFDDFAWDPGLDLYRENMIALNDIVARSGEVFEGGLFFGHLASQLGDTPVATSLAKRRNFAVFAMAGASLLEIGFNAGHSALLALTVNPDLRYTGVDIGGHGYTAPCFDYLRSVFGDRVHLNIGDSRDVLPILRQESKRYDLLHIDGGHGFATAHTDLLNGLDLCVDGAAMLMDDTDDARIDKLCDFYAVRGILTRTTLTRLWSPPIGFAHSLFRVHRPRAG